jgi:hypothetical protein
MQEVAQMSPEIQPASGSKAMLWTGWIISALIALALVMSAVLKFVQPGDFVGEFTRLGWPGSLAVALGIVEFTCAILYAVPQTAVLGAILVTGYLGGAIATHVRIEEQFVPPLIMGLLAWAGLYLRDSRLRSLVPWRSVRA